MVDYKKFQKLYSKTITDQKPSNPTGQTNPIGQKFTSNQKTSATDARQFSGQQTQQYRRQGAPYRGNQQTNQQGQASSPESVQQNSQDTTSSTAGQYRRQGSSFGGSNQYRRQGAAPFGANQQNKPEGNNSEFRSQYEANKMGYVFDETDASLGSDVKVKAEKNSYFPGRRRNFTQNDRRFVKSNNTVEDIKYDAEKVYQKQQFDIKISGEISTNELAKLMNEKASDVLKFLMKNGLSVNINQDLDIDIIELIVNEFGHNFIMVDSKLEEQKLLSSEQNEKYERFPRPPIVSVMGHVDHGKTTLLDTIRKSNVASDEVGGITQKIGAYQIKYNEHDITFIDTPGHEAFSAIRSRGANLTDIVILVVSADDGIMPQTVEAIKHAQKANVPIIVAINKIDKQPNIDNIKNALMSYDVIPDDLGGSSIVIPISAKNNTNIDALMEAVLLQTELLQLSARRDGLAQGVIVDSRIDRKRGCIATLIIKEGILRVGDNIIAGDKFGKIRILSDYQGKSIKEAYPSQPVEVAGFSEIPKCGETFYILKDEKAINEAREMIEKNKEVKHHVKKAVHFNQDLKVLNLIIKADSQGSLEAINNLIKKISLPNGEIRILLSEPGIPSNTDINMSILSKALILSFNAELTNDTLLRTIKEKNISYKEFKIIYELVDYVREKFEGLFPPVEEEVDEGTAEVRGLFTISKVGLVLGCIIKSGAARRGSMVRVKRKGVLLGKYKISSIRRLKDDVKEVTTGLECGISIEGKIEAQLGDTVEMYKIILKSPFKKD